MTLTVTRRRSHFLARRAYAALALMVLAGLAGMHSGSAGTPAGGHGVLAMSAHAVADTEHPVAAALGADVSVTALSAPMIKYATDHDGVTAGCMLAFTGILGLALACLAQRVPRQLIHDGPVRSRWQLPYQRQRVSPAPLPGLLLCVLRT